jgi:XrtJ-associated TM-motif-TM protein
MKSLPSRISFVSLLVLALAMTPLAAHAQGGCVNSPENPTVVLALIGGAAGAIKVLRSRVGSRRRG